MKIAILTLPLGNNFGGNIQNWALQQVLHRMGHLPVTLDAYNTVRVNNGVFANLRRVGSAIFSSCRRYIKKDYRIYVNNPWMRNYTVHEPLTLDKNFRSKIFTSDRFAFNDSDWQIRTGIDNFDAFIVGSDQVWRQEYSPRIESFFLDFLSETDSRYRIAYGASFGKLDSDIDADKMAKCRQLLSHFKAVSVREYSGLSILNRDFGYNKAIKVIDPTLLLKANDYLTLIRPNDCRGSCAAAYILDEDPDKLMILNSVSQHLNLTIRRVDIMYKGIHRPSMSEWLAMYADADFVITDSYHGCVFSIIFGKPFVAIANHWRGIDRFVSLLEPLGLSNRLVLNIEKFRKSYQELLMPIEYDAVNAKLEEQRQQSIDFLSNALA